LYGVGFSLKGYFFALQKLFPEEFVGQSCLQAVLPNLFTLLTLVMVYTLVPNRKVKFWHAFWGAVTAMFGFFLMRKFFSTFIASSVAYTTLYGAMAAIPLLLVWLYLNWAVVIFGASLTAALDEYDDNKTFEKQTDKSLAVPKKHGRTKKFLPKEQN
jgi:membrane protein